jgi:SNF2 family DNA or RNA helicase
VDDHDDVGLLREGLEDESAHASPLDRKPQTPEQRADWKVDTSAMEECSPAWRDSQADEFADEGVLLESDEMTRIKNGLEASAKAAEGVHDPGPSTLNTTLLKHQQIGLAWMAEQERKHFKGGILADDMGLGKTVQAIAVMLRNAPASDSSNLRKAFRTLVVAPMSMLEQWEEELRTLTKLDLAILIHHGDTKATKPEELVGKDVVITSYGTLCTEAPELDKKGDNPFRKKRELGPLYKLRWLRVILDEVGS